MYDDIKHNLRDAYAKKVSERDSRQIQPWKVEERTAFLSELEEKDNLQLLEVGAGTGQDSLHFQSKGINVTCIDLAPDHVQMCREKGLNAQVMDVCQLQFEENYFDAVFSLNCLLHLPKDKFPVALGQIRSVLKTGGIFYLGIYGGYNFAGVWEEDSYDPKRFYSFYSDDLIEMIVKEYFDLLSFRKIPLDDDHNNPQLHFQSFLLKKPLAT